MSVVINPYVFGSLLPLAVSFVGVETGSAANNYSVQNWSNASVPKLHSVGGSNRYGTAGFYQIRPVTPFNAGYSIQFGEAVGAPNDLGIGSGTFPTLYSAPTFAAVTGSAGTYVNYGPYSVFRAPNGVDLVRLGGLSVPSSTYGSYNSGNFDGRYGSPFYINLTQSVRFRLGIVTDFVGGGQYAPVAVSIVNSVLGQVDSPEDSLANDGDTDITFFDISGNSGDIFVIRLYQTVAQASVTATGLITFDLL